MEYFIVLQQSDVSVLLMLQTLKTCIYIILVFTRHWKNLTEVQTSAGSGSFSKSFSSQKSYCEQVDSDEMIEAIEMLVKAVHSNSTGKQVAFFVYILKANFGVMFFIG